MIFLKHWLISGCSGTSGARSSWLQFGYAIFAAAENFLVDAEFEGLKIQQQTMQASIPQATVWEHHVNK